MHSFGDKLQHSPSIFREWRGKIHHRCKLQISFGLNDTLRNKKKLKNVLNTNNTNANTAVTTTNTTLWWWCQRGDCLVRYWTTPQTRFKTCWSVTGVCSARDSFHHSWLLSSTGTHFCLWLPSYITPPSDSHTFNDWARINKLLCIHTQMYIVYLYFPIHYFNT